MNEVGFFMIVIPIIGFVSFTAYAMITSIRAVLSKKKDPF